MDIQSLKQIATLSKLKIEDDSIEALLSDFNKIVSYVDKIKELDTSSIQDDEIYEAHINFIRQDKIGDCLKREDIASIAPKFESGYIVVPRVIET